MFQAFLRSDAAGGVILMASALLALLAANSPLAPWYFGLQQVHAGPLTLLEWVNDGLMALFFLVVGMEIKREMLTGGLATWSQRLLPGAAATGGMVIPALIYLAFNHRDALTARGWAIPMATDIAFALGVLSLLGPRIPASLRTFLSALAVIDDLGAVIIIALFYAHGLSWPDLAGAAVVAVALAVLNRRGVGATAPYLLLGAALWILVLRSGIHATIAGVLLALLLPMPVLLRLEHRLYGPVAYAVVPVFGFANAGVSFAGMTPAVLTSPMTLGIAGGLLLGKLCGVFGTVMLMVRTGLARLPAGATWNQLFGVALLCGIGFTMSLFIALLAFDAQAARDAAKFGILAGSLLAGLAGYLVLRCNRR